MKNKIKRSKLWVRVIYYYIRFKITKEYLARLMAKELYYELISE